MVGMQWPDDGFRGGLRHVSIRNVAKQEWQIDVCPDDMVDELKLRLKHDCEIKAIELTLVQLGLMEEDDVELEKGHALSQYDPLIWHRKVLMVPDLPKRPSLDPWQQELQGWNNAKTKMSDSEREATRVAWSASRPPLPQIMPPVVPKTEGADAAQSLVAAPEVPAALSEGHVAKAVETGNELRSPLPTASSLSALSSVSSTVSLAAAAAAASSVAGTSPPSSVKVPVASQSLHLPEQALHKAPQRTPQQPQQHQQQVQQLQPSQQKQGGHCSPPRPGSAQVPMLQLHNQQQQQQQQKPKQSSPRLEAMKQQHHHQQQQQQQQSPPRSVSTMPLQQVQVSPAKALGSCPVLPMMPVPPMPGTKKEATGSKTPAPPPRVTSPPPTARQVATTALPLAPTMQRLPVVPGSMSWSPPAASGDASPPSSVRLVGPSASASSSQPHAAHASASASASVSLRDRIAVASTPGPPALHRVRQKDLQRIGKLGVGAFGVVTLEVDKRTGKTYALKAVSKGYLAELNMEYSVLNEKKILKMVDSVFVVRLMATYNGREHVFFLLEAALGGELFTTYERLRLYGSEKHARFYVACVTEALTHLHERHVIYRDLKPENLLLDSTGYCKLTDMGLAKVVQSGLTRSVVGTPDYMAPEVIMQSGHGKAVDWWMLGVLLFELLSGRAPFEAPTTLQTYDLIQKGIEHTFFPPDCPRRGTELIKVLCRHNPESRIRTPVLREHGFFRGYDWAQLRLLRLEPPYRPVVRGPRDLGNFRSLEGEDPPLKPYHDNGSGWDIGFEDDSLGSTRAQSLNPPPVGNRDRSHQPHVFGLSHDAHARENMVVLSPRSAAAESAPTQPLRPPQQHTQQVPQQQTAQAQQSRHHYPQAQVQAQQRQPQSQQQQQHASSSTAARWQAAGMAAMASSVSFKGASAPKSPHSPTNPVRLGGC